MPDFANLGVLLRVLLLVNALALLAALARNEDWRLLPQELVQLAALVEPPLIGLLLAGVTLRAPLQRLSRARSWPLLAALGAAGASLFARALPAGETAPDPLRTALWGALAVLAVLAYFDVRSRVFSPAHAEGRLIALTARIRPHFLFNSLNAVLGVMRSDPRRAEVALEELADLFRVLMRENRELTTLGEELALCRQYLDLERLRLGERLAVKWQTERCPEDALVPPLMLQPLLENAVYHGIEPAAGTGEIVIAVGRKGGEVLIALTNPYLETARHTGGNRMALDNIRERLMLFFDLEARLDTAVVDGEYRVRIRLPYRTREAA